MQGTTANLKAGDYISVRHLIHGMMLPSGNDAAQALAIYFGTMLNNKGKSDPNSAMTIPKDIVEQRQREIIIQVAFNFNKKRFLAEKKQELPKRIREHNLRLKALKSECTKLSNCKSSVLP
jgi:cell fate regulator YaaT (PSP1 superfamily)